MGMFIENNNGDYKTNASRLVAVKRFFDTNPNGKVKTGIWTESTWDKDGFYKWFRKCLFAKCGGGALTERQRNKMFDGRKINDYFGKRVRHSGCMNILRDPSFQKLYPQVNTQPFEI